MMPTSIVTLAFHSEANVNPSTGLGKLALNPGLVFASREPASQACLISAEDGTVCVHH